MKSLKIFSIISLMMASYAGTAQELTTPQLEGYVSGSTMKVSFPFSIKGIPFSQIPGSVWSSRGKVIAELQMTYYIEGDDKKYVNKRIISVNPRQTVGSWSLPGLSVEPKPSLFPTRGVVSEKTTYQLSVYQNHNYKNSKMWSASIQRVSPTVKPHIAIDQKPSTHVIPQQPAVDKIPDQNKGPIKVNPKDKVILNPQPIPPKEKLIKRKTGGL